MDPSINLQVSIDPEVKEQAESILNELGISASTAINIFYRQVIFHKGLPFEVRLPKHPLDISQMTAEKLDAKLEKGYADMLAGRTIPSKQAFADIRNET